MTGARSSLVAGLRLNTKIIMIIIKIIIIIIVLCLALSKVRL